jgi:anti-sigma regulatory factor (Ser/Thr protein kinase)
MARALRARPQAAADARRAIAGLALSQATRETLALLVTELVTNAIRHAGLRPGDPIDVQTSDTGDHRVRLAVHDSGKGFEPPSLDDHEPLAGGGRGLLIVSALSERWGVDRDDAGCTVWCEVAPQPPGAIEHEATTRYLSELAVQLAR